MNTQRYAPAEAYPTRRSLREAEKRARKGERRTFRPVTPERETKATAPEVGSRIPERTYAQRGPDYRVPQIPFPPVRGKSEPVNFPIIPEQVDELPPAPKPATRRGRLVPRVAILGSLAAATTVIPLNGPPTSAANAEEGVEYGATDVLDVLMDVDPEVAAEPEADALSADPMVGVRAAVSASRNTEREPGSCSALAGSVNGAAAAEVASRAPEVVMPLTDGSYRISSRYGHRSLWGRYSLHTGIDFAASAGTPIHSIADGVVEYTGPGKAGRSSMLIIVRHEIDGETIRSWYVHMYSNGVYTAPGQQVKAGEVIGSVGSNGNSTGPHLHFEIHLDDNLTTTDPAAWLANNGAVPLDQETRECLEQ